MANEISSTGLLLVALIILVGLYMWTSCSLNCKSKNEGFYNNNVNSTPYLGANPLLFTQNPGCNGCGYRVPSCWRESMLCGVDKACY